jgi:endonuclease/exonuclease/phosphatase family metal-dependent hydrolase
MLCDVRIRQSNSQTVDFRCAIVHLKSTDQQLKDTGNTMRLAAAEELGRWIERDMQASGERDFIVMGDMNAETARQGLKSFAEEHRLLSVGMQEKYGKDQALTRVASKRLLDHIVITSDVEIPKQDLGEQIIIRSDLNIGTWIKAYSDHVPVAVRLVLGRDDDETPMPRGG